MTREFEGKVVVVTGGTSGIGRATATAFAAAGGTVVIAGRRADLGEEVVSEIRSSGGSALFMHTDVRDRESVRRMIAATVRLYGRLDCAFNNAGIAGENFRATADQDEETWREVFETNVTGVFLCMKYEIPEMLRTGGGAIINTGSIFSLVGAEFGIAPYVASKHAVLGLTRAAALDYARKGIRVNAICPGITRSQMTAPALEADPHGFMLNVDRSVPMGRIAEAQEIARAVLWLCSEASFVTGQALCVDGGWLAK